MKLHAIAAAFVLLLPSLARADNALILEEWNRKSVAQKHVAVREVASVVYLITDSRHMETVCNVLMADFRIRREFFDLVDMALAKDGLLEKTEALTLSAVIASVILLVEAGTPK